MSLFIERLFLVILSAAMVLAIATQDFSEDLRWKVEGKVDRHATCQLAKSFNCWMNTSFGSDDVEFDAHNRQFTINRSFEQCSPAVARVMAILTGRQYSHYLADKDQNSTDGFFPALGIGRYERNRLSDTFSRTLALLTLGSCLALLGTRQLIGCSAKSESASGIAQLLRRQTLEVALVLFSGGWLFLTYMQLGVCKYDCQEVQATGYSMGSIQHGDRVLTTCTFDGRRWGLPQLITIFGVEQFQADHLNGELYFWRDSNVRVIGQPKPYKAHCPFSPVGIWNRATHPTARTLDALTLCYGFAYPLLAMLWRRRAAVAIYLAKKAPSPSHHTFESALSTALQSPPIASIPRVGFVEMIEIQLGPMLESIYRSGLPSDLMERSNLNLFNQLGVEMPPVRLSLSPYLPQHGYSIRMREVEVERGILFNEEWLAIGSQTHLDLLTGHSAENPILGLPGCWIATGEVSHARELGCMVMSARQVLVTHLNLAVSARAWLLVGHQETHDRLEQLSETHPGLVGDAISCLGVSPIKQVLQRLLHEQVPIRDLPLIIETMMDLAETNIMLLTEAVRRALGATICLGLSGPSRCLKVVTLDPALEHALKEPDVSVVCDFLKAVDDKFCSWSHETPPVLLTSPEMRSAIRFIVSSDNSDLAILSWAEIPSGMRVEVSSMLSL